MRHFGGDDVLRFLGRSGNIRQYRTAQLQSDLKARHEGVRLKHTLNRNSLKMYDKQWTILRIETTINDARDMKVFPAGGREIPRVPSAGCGCVREWPTCIVGRKSVKPPTSDIWR